MWGVGVSECERCRPVLQSAEAHLKFFSPLLDSPWPSVAAGSDPQLILALFSQRPGAESVPSLSFSSNII